MSPHPPDLTCPHHQLRLRRAFAWLCFTLAVVPQLLAGCSDDPENQENQFSQAEDCVAILDVCTHDTSGALAEECHELAHDNAADACGERKDECIAYCESAGGGGGAAGAGGAEH